MLLCGGTGRAGDPELEQLKAQVERQQRQIENLQKALEDKIQPVMAEGAAEPPDKKAVEKVVADYLKAEDKKKKDADDNKKKEAEEEGYEVGKDLIFKPSWKDGPYWETGDKAFSGRLRGRVHNDWGWASADPEVDAPTAAGGIGFLEEGVIFRRARLGVEGKIYEVFDYVAEFDFASGSDIAFREVWMGVHDLPYVGAFRAGHYKEYFSLEQLMSSKYMTFIERSIVDDAFAPAYNPGMSFTNTYGCEENGTWAIGLFRPASDNGGQTVDSSNDTDTNVEADGIYAVTARTTYLPWYEHDGRCLIHLGAAISQRELEDGDVVFRSRPYRMNPVRNFIATPTLQGADILLTGAEAAFVFGPFSMQAELVRAELNDASSGATDFGDASFYGYYVYASYFLTGEHRPYRKTHGIFDRVKPHENFWLVKTGDDGCCGCCCGKGAWEVAARYAYVDLNDSGIVGGQLDQYTLGLTWYWNPNMKVMWNYEWFDVDRSGEANDGQVRSFVMRFSFDW